MKSGVFLFDNEPTHKSAICNLRINVFQFLSNLPSKLLLELHVFEEHTMRI